MFYSVQIFIIGPWFADEPVISSLQILGRLCLLYITLVLMIKNLEITFLHRWNKTNAYFQPRLRMYIPRAFQIYIQDHYEHKRLDAFLR